MIRDTAQRRLIRRLLRDAGRPLAPREVLLLAQAEKARIGLATVYRNLSALVREGWLVPVDLPGEGTRYELSGKGHHHHFRCRTCARVFEIEGCALQFDPDIPKGFKIESHDVILFGQCAGCMERDGPRSRQSKKEAIPLRRRATASGKSSAAPTRAAAASRSRRKAGT